MNDLIERLEKATGPDRELDKDIWLAVTPGATWKRTRVTGHQSGREWDVDEPRINGGRLVDIPMYSASLDAAMTLVPEGLAWTLGQNVHHRYWQASVNNLDEDGRPQSIGYSGLQGNLTAPIALCIAALRARDSAERDLTKKEAGK